MSAAIEVSETPSAALMRIVAPLEASKGERLRGILSPVFAAVEEWKAEAAMLQVTDVSQVGKMQRARGLRLEIRKKRVAVVKRLEELKADALAEQRIINDVIRLYTGLLETMETDLNTSETFAKRAEAARVEELRKEREELLVAQGVSKVAMPAALGTMSPDAWATVHDDAVAAKQAREDAARVAQETRVEAARIAAEKEAERRKEAERAAQRQLDEDALREENERLKAEQAQQRETERLLSAQGEVNRQAITDADARALHARMFQRQADRASDKIGLVDVHNEMMTDLSDPYGVLKQAPNVAQELEEKWADIARMAKILTEEPGIPHRFTASKSSILLSCNAWLAPGVRWNEDSDAGAELGVEKHGLAAAEIDGSEFSASDRAHEALEAMRPLLQQLKARGKAMTEVAFAYDIETDTARVLCYGRSREEAYTLAEAHEITGTADLVVLGEGPNEGIVFVDDHKSWAPGVHVDARAQLRTLGLFAARAFKADIVEIGTVLMGDSEARRVDIEQLDWFEIEQISITIEERLKAPIAPPNTGKWCRWCPHRTFCKAAEVAMDQMVADQLADTVPATSLVRRDRKLTIDIQDAEQLEFTLSALVLVEQRKKAIWKAVCDYADREVEVPLSDGTVFSGKEVTTERPSLTVPGALDEIRLAGAADAVVPSTTWRALTHALGKDQAAALRETLRAIGAVDRRTKVRYKVRRADREEEETFDE